MEQQGRVNESVGVSRPPARWLVPSGRAVALGVLVWLGSACMASDGERVYSARAGFANDDSGLFVVLDSRVERAGYMDDVLTSDYVYEIRVAEPDGTMQRTVLERRDRSLGEVYYEAEAGYLLAISTDGGRSTGWRAEVVRLDGDVAVLEEGNLAPPLFLPDPSGSLIARVRSLCDPGCSSWQSRLVLYVSFYDAATLERVGELHALEWPRRERPGSTVTWSPDGRLVVSDGIEAFALAPEGGREPVAVPACRGHFTAGGRASDGRSAQASWDGEGVEVTVTAGDAPGWPDRCFGEGS